MKFFRAQENARRSTGFLLLLFTLAVVALISAANLLVMSAFFFTGDNEHGATSPSSANTPVGTSSQSTDYSAFLQSFDWAVFGVVSLLVVGVVAAGTFYKLLLLREGGTGVATMLGGRLISHDTRDQSEKRLINVVEEMAIASGIPVPMVYVLDHEAGLNAFAAGFTSGDAVIGVTKGLLTRLTRDELQGVIAHEFSHIFNGDMRLNMRLIGILHGILVIGLLGEFILRSMRYSSGRRDGAGAAMALGVGLLIIGYGGTFFGKIIKAAVSRQREYLADASAVQFTRNPSGIANALKVIGGASTGSTLIHPRASQLSHAYFAGGVPTFINFLFGTHPPLADRIRTLDPRWDGTYISRVPNTLEDERDERSPTDNSAKEQLKRGVTTTALAAAIIERVGQIGIENVGYAHAQLNAIPVPLLEAAHEPFGARALLYMLLLDDDEQIRAKQLEYLQADSDTDLYDFLQRILPLKSKIGLQLRLPIIDLTVPALRQLSQPQRKRFQSELRKLMEADSKIDLFEWCLEKLIQHHLDDASPDGRAMKRGAQSRDLMSMGDQCELVVSVLAYASQNDERAAQVGFDAAMRVLGRPGIKLIPKDVLKLNKFENAMQTLAQTKPLQKPLLLKALTGTALADGKLDPREIELLRAFSAILNCPIPPLEVESSN